MEFKLLPLSVECNEMKSVALHTKPQLIASCAQMKRLQLSIIYLQTIIHSLTHTNHIMCMFSPFRTKPYIRLHFGQFQSAIHK